MSVIAGQCQVVQIGLYDLNLLYDSIQNRDFHIAYQSLNFAFCQEINCQTPTVFPQGHIDTHPFHCFIAINQKS